MSLDQPRNYLRTHRRRIGLTQKEVAFLLGCNNHGMISLYERAKRTPSLTTIFAYESIFSIPSKQLLPAVAEQIERQTHQRMKELLNNLSAKPPHPRCEAAAIHLQNVITKMSH